MTTLLHFIHEQQERLSAAVGDDEARAMMRVIAEDVWGYKPLDVMFHGQDEVSDFRQDQVKGIVQRVLDGEPLQYVLGQARFMGNDYLVTPATLIPRPETEGLVDLAVDALGQRKDLRVLDIGTGSGIIAIALARALPFAHVEATDISPQALEVATANARRLKARVSLRRDDVLNPVVTDESYDLIVSNPPYIAEKERAAMDARVWAYEPNQALFVPNDNPLVFYRAIGSYGNTALVKGGWLMCELNPLYATELRQLWQSLGYEDVELHRDYKGNLRYITAQWKA